MRWPASFSLCLLLSAGAASARRKHDFPDMPTVYLYDPQSPSDTDAAVVDPHVAGLILAHRLGLASYHSLREICDLDLQHLNQYTNLASKSSSNPREDGYHDHALVLIDHSEAIDEDDIPSDLTTFQLSMAPRLEDGPQLLDNFHAQARALYGSAEGFDHGTFTGFLESGKDEERRMTWLAWGSERRRIHMQYRDVKRAGRKYGQELISELINTAMKDQIALTLIVNPKPTRGSGIGWNVYGGILEKADSLLRRRQEAPLVEPAETSEATPSSTSRVSAPTSTASATSFPLTPKCFDSTDSCESETNSCSGHGKCVLTRKGPASGDDEDPAECYQCRCTPSVVKNSDGSSKTTYYGGIACQKQDISAPFWILTLTAGSLIALVGFGVSMLYAMGSAELPSVIGAGVSGPRAK